MRLAAFEAHVSDVPRRTSTLVDDISPNRSVQKGPSERTRPPDYRLRWHERTRPDHCCCPPRPWQTIWGRRCGQFSDARHLRGRVPHPSWPIWFWQDNGVAHDCRIRTTLVWFRRTERRRRDQHSRFATKRQHGLPGLCALPSHERARQRGIRTQSEEGAGGRTQATCDGCARVGPPRSTRRKTPVSIVGWSATARGTRPSARQPTQGPPPRRTARRARLETPRGDAT